MRGLIKVKQSQHSLKNVNTYIISMLISYFISFQPGTKTTQSRGNHPWSQVLYWLWRKRGQPVHTSCKIGGQNCNGVQGMWMELSLHQYHTAVVWCVCWCLLVCLCLGPWIPACLWLVQSFGPSMSYPVDIIISRNGPPSCYQLPKNLLSASFRL